MVVDPFTLFSFLPIKPSYKSHFKQTVCVFGKCSLHINLSVVLSVLSCISSSVFGLCAPKIEIVRQAGSSFCLWQMGIDPFQLAGNK